MLLTALFSDGRVYGWGINKFGQLGVRELGDQYTRDPVLITSLSGVPIKQVSAPN